MTVNERIENDKIVLEVEGKVDRLTTQQLQDAIFYGQSEYLKDRKKCLTQLCWALFPNLRTNATKFLLIAYHQLFHLK